MELLLATAILIGIVLLYRRRRRAPSIARVEPPVEAVRDEVVDGWLVLTPREPVPDTAIRVRYTAWDGERTERLVTPVRARGRWNTRRADMLSIEVRCHARRAERTLYLSRIDTAWDPQTGEVLNPLVDALAARLGVHIDPPTPLERFEDEATVLVHMARSDGRMTAADCGVIADLILARCGTNATQAREEVMEALKRWTVTPQEFRAAARRAAASDENYDREALVRAAETVIDAGNGRREGNEDAALASLRRALGIRAPRAAKVRSTE